MSIKKNVWTGPLILLLALSAVMTSWAAGGQKTEHAETGGALTMDVTYGYGNKAKGGRYVPLDLLFENHEQKRFAGSLQVLAMESDYEVYQYDYPLEINEGESLEKHLYIPMGNRWDQLFVSVADSEGTQVFHRRLKMDFSLDVPELFVGVLSDTPEPLVAG